MNRRGTPTYDPAPQRNHLFPRRLSGKCRFGAFFGALGQERIGFHDFRRNGLLLPARVETMERLALPLHRGPLRDYNAMVIERVGRIEGHWSRHCPSEPSRAA